MNRAGHRPAAQELANSPSSNREINEVFGVLEDNEGKWPQPELPGANNIEETVPQMNNGGGSSRLHCAGSVGFAGSSKTLQLAPAEPDDLPTTRDKARSARIELSSGEDATGDSSSGGHGSDDGGRARPRSKLPVLLPLPGPSTVQVPTVRSSTIANGEPEIPSGGGDDETRGAGKG